MATPIRIKRSAVSGKRPQLTDLQVGELALNTYDGSLFTERDTGGVGIATTVSNLTPWTESYGASSISYLNSVGIGTDNPTAKLDVDGTIKATSFSGSAAGFTNLTGASAGTYGNSTVVPQIDVDANGIMNIEAKDKGSGNVQNITIKNDKGRLSQEDIERMVNEGEKYAEEDRLHKETIESKNKLDSLVYQTKSTIENDNIKSKIEETDLKLVLDVLTETELWLDSDHSKDEYENKMRLQVYVNQSCNE